MRTHTNNFKNNIKTLGRQFNVRVVYGGTTLQNEQINNATLNYNGDILKSVMKVLKLDSNIDIPLNTQISFEFGLLVGNSYEYINYGTFIVDKSEKQENTNSYLLTCYDKMLYSMKPYEDLGITYPITIRNYISALCTKLGLQFQNASNTFVNYNKQIPNELYLDEQGNSLDYNYRDVLDELAQVTASTICINDSGKLEIRYITNTNDTIDEEFLKNVNVNFGEQYGAINTITFSRSADSDSISKSIPENLPDADKIEIKISDNQILNGNNRDEFIDGILNQLYGLSYYVNDFSSTGITYYDLCDRYNITVGENTYSCVMLNDEININNGLVENVFTNMPKTSKTDYSKVDKTDRKVNQTNLIVDKQNGKIDAVVSQIEEIEQDLQNPTSTKEGKYFDLEDALDSPLIDFSLYGDTQQDSTPTPSSPQEIHNVSGDNTIEICGKNLLKLRTDNSSGTSYNEETQTYTSNTRTGVSTWYMKIKTTSSSYTFSTQSITSAEYRYCFSNNNLNNGADIVALTYISGGNITNGNITVNNNANLKYLYVTFRTTTNNTIGSLVKPMLEIGSSSSEYEAYTGNSQLISLGVENEYKASKTIQGTFNANSSLTNTRITWFGKQVSSGETMTITCNNANLRFGTGRTSMNEQNASNVLSQDSGWQTSTYTITFNGSGYAYIVISKTDNTNISTSDLTDTDYTITYNGNHYSSNPIELNKISTYQDYIYKENDRWFLHKEIGKTIITNDNVNDIIVSTTSYWNVNGAFASKTQLGYKTAWGSNYTLINKYYEITATNQVANGAFASNFNSSYLILFNNNFSDLTTARNELIGTEICIILDTPTDTEITDTTLLEQLNNLMTLPLYKNLTHITLTPNDLQPTMKIEYYRDTSINENFVSKEDMTKYYTKTETNAQIQISNSSIQQNVSELSNTVNSNTGSITSISNQVQNLQTSTSQQINIINEQLEDGVQKVKTTTGYTLDGNGLSITKGQGFSSLTTDRYQKIEYNNKELSFMGYDDNLNKPISRIEELEARKITTGVHRTETIEEDNEYWTAQYYVGGGR